MSSIDICDTIPEFFEGKNVFITGGSGFMGKALIEKLLRSCPKIGNIYILLRLKKSQTLQEKLDGIINNILFDTIRKTDPEALKKVIALHGDIQELNLGLSEEDRQTIIDNVSIVYHVAAIVRFNDTLKDAIFINTRGTREVCSLVLSLKTVDVFVHVSTAYCQIDKKEIDERLYDNHTNWRNMIKVAETADPYQLQILHLKIMDVFPNTYTYSKALAEAVVKDMCLKKVPTVVIRPTIVLSIYKDPFPGWNDNMNGPIALFIARGKGLLRTNYGTKNIKLDFVPLDYVIKACIKAAWHQQYLGKDIISVYNCSCEGIYSVTSDFLLSFGQECVYQIGMKSLWYPNARRFTKSKFLYLIHIYFLHLIPAIIVDTILKISDKPPQLLKIQRKVFTAMKCLEYFMHHEWQFINNKTLELDDYLSESDRHDFAENLSDFAFDEYFIMGSRVFMKIMLHEPEQDIDKNQARNTRMGYIHKTIKYFFTAFLVYWFLRIVVQPITKSCIQYVESL